MQINWKALADSPGYRSLKKAYCSDAYEAGRYKQPMRSKQDYLRRFYWVINRAKHYAIHQGRALESVLNEWEADRSYWWVNYYQENNQPKLSLKKKNPITHLTFLRKHHRGFYGKIWYFKKHRDAVRKAAVDARKAAGKPARWTSAQKKRNRK